VSLVVCGVSVCWGLVALGFFGVNVDDFRVAGGIVLLIIALGMLSGRGAASTAISPARRAAGLAVSRVVGRRVVSADMSSIMRIRALIASLCALQTWDAPGG